MPHHGIVIAWHVWHACFLARIPRCSTLPFAMHGAFLYKADDNLVVVPHGKLPEGRDEQLLAQVWPATCAVRPSQLQDALAQLL